MFFLEHFMKKLKDFVRQNAQPEGSMSEGWLNQESQFVIAPPLLHQSFAIGD
jgi:hypothetical protein